MLFRSVAPEAKYFTQVIKPTGLVITKLDGTARGGAAVALRRELEVPIRFLGLGEGLEDLVEFDSVAFGRDLVESGADE